MTPQKRSDVTTNTEKGDVATNEGVKGDGGVHATFGDVGAKGYGDTKAERVGSVRTRVGKHGDELN